MIFTTHLFIYIFFWTYEKDPMWWPDHSLFSIGCTLEHMLQSNTIKRFLAIFWRLTFSGHILTRLIFVFLSTEVRTYWAVETLGDLQSTSRGLDPGVKM
jgi:hypothetical protein